jgi:hypothetical protein
VRFFFSMEAMINERLDLLERPEEEAYLHWARNETLHGCLLPPDDGARHSVTSDGWCPCWARQDAAVVRPAVGADEGLTPTL